ncbi:MAG: nuclear transport factor 2 family protein [Pseudomonadota bacterium]
MPTPSKTLIELENKFWQAVVDEDADAAVELLNEPSMLVGAQGAMKFDHEAYRKMTVNPVKKLTRFELSDVEVVFPNEATAVLTYHVKQHISEQGKTGNAVQEMNDSSTWIKTGSDWKCVMHTETPAGDKPRTN